MGFVGALHSLRSFRRRLPWALGLHCIDKQPIMKSKILASIAAIFLAGCASQTLPKNYSLNPNGVKGIIVASITYNGTFGLHSINIKSSDNSVRERLAVGQITFVPIPQNYDINDLGVKGNVFSFELPQGIYEVARWNVDSYSANIGAPTPIRFAVEAGKITYLGRFEFQQLSTNGVVVTKVALSVKDESLKDMEIVKARTPSLSNEHVSINVSTSTAAQTMNQTVPSTEYVPPFIFIPPAK
jgi:hypothetical protein